MNFSTSNKRKMRSEKGNKFVELVPKIVSYDYKQCPPNIFNPWSERVLKNISLNWDSEDEHKHQLQLHLHNHTNSRSRSLDINVRLEHAAVSRALNEAIAESNRFISDLKDIRSEIETVIKDRERARKRAITQKINVLGDEVVLYTALINFDDICTSEVENDGEAFLSRRNMSYKRGI